MIDTMNLERFSKQLTFMNKDALLTIRRLLNGIKTCHTEFKLSRAEDYAAQIDIDHIRKLLKAVQARIDFVNLKSTPTNLLAIISNKEVVDILYEFFKTKIEILDLGKLVDAMKKFATTEEYKELTELVTKVQNEIKRNRNHNQIEMVKLDELLQKLFRDMDIANIAEMNDELRKALEEAKRINDENERISARYDGSYAFVKTYTDAVEIHPEYDKEDIAAVMDIVYEAVKEMIDSIKVEEEKATYKNSTVEGNKQIGTIRLNKNKEYEHGYKLTYEVPTKYPEVDSLGSDFNESVFETETINEKFYTQISLEFDYSSKTFDEKVESFKPIAGSTYENKETYRNLKDSGVLTKTISGKQIKYKSFNTYFTKGFCITN